VYKLCGDFQRTGELLPDVDVVDVYPLVELVETRRRKVTARKNGKVRWYLHRSEPGYGNNVAVRVLAASLLRVMTTEEEQYTAAAKLNSLNLLLLFERVWSENFCAAERCADTDIGTRVGLGCYHRSPCGTTHPHAQLLFCAGIYYRCNRIDIFFLLPLLLEYDPHIFAVFARDLFGLLN